MKKLLIASAITLAGLAAMAAGSYADAKDYRQNSAYCRLSNTTDVLCKSRGWKAAAAQGPAQGLAVTSGTIANKSKYCRDDSTHDDPLCWKKVKYDEPVYEIEDPVSTDDPVEIDDPVTADAPGFY